MGLQIFFPHFRKAGSLRRIYPSFSLRRFLTFVISCGDEFGSNNLRLELTGRQDKRGLRRLIDCVSIGAQFRVGELLGLRRFFPQFRKGLQLEEKIPFRKKVQKYT